MPLGQKSGQKYLIVFIQNTNANRHWPTGHFVIDRNWPNHPLINNSVDLIWNWINWYCHTIYCSIKSSSFLLIPLFFPTLKVIFDDSALKHMLQGMTHDGFNHLIHSENTHLGQTERWWQPLGSFPFAFFVLLLRKQPNIPWHSPRSDSVSSLFFPLWQWLQSSIAKNQTPKCETRK